MRTCSPGDFDRARWEILESWRAGHQRPGYKHGFCFMPCTWTPGMVNMFAPVYVSNLYIRSNVQRNIVYTWFVGYMFMWYHSKSMSIFQKRALFQCILKCPISYMRAYIYICMYIYVYVYMYIYVCMYVWCVHHVHRHNRGHVQACHVYASTQRSVTVVCVSLHQQKPTA